MSKIDAKNTCSNCEEFDASENGTIGFCRHFQINCFSTSSCGYRYGAVELSPEIKELITACCAYKRLPNDCELTRVFDIFLDSWLFWHPFGRHVARSFRRNIPIILEQVNNMEPEERCTFFENLYRSLVKIKEYIDRTEYASAAQYLEKLYLQIRLKYDPAYCRLIISAKDQPYTFYKDSEKDIYTEILQKRYFRFLKE